VVNAPTPNGFEDGFDKAGADVEPEAGVEEMPKLNDGSLGVSIAAESLSPFLSDEPPYVETLDDGNALDVPPKPPNNCEALEPPASMAPVSRFDWVAPVDPKANFD